MNFYSVDNFDNVPIESVKIIDDLYEMPITVSKLTDNFYKCSDSYEIIDETNQKSSNFVNFTESECKEKCMNNHDCVAFNYNSNIKACHILSNATSLYNINNNNVFCVKKNSYSKCDIPKTSIPLPDMKTMPETTEFNPKAMVDKVKKSTCKINNTYAFAKLDNLFEKIQNKNESKSENLVVQEMVNNVGPIINKINTDESFIDTESFIDAESPMYHQFCNKLLGTIDKCKLNIENKNLLSNNIDNKSMNLENFSNIDNLMDKIKNMSEQEIGKNMSEQEMARMNKNMSEQEMARMNKNMSEQEMARMRNMSEQEMARMNKNMSEQEMARMNKNMAEQEMGKDMIKPKIYVDLNCFMNKMQNFSSHSDNIMIDVNLLTSNIKSCAYVSKTDEISKMNKPQGNLVDQVTSLIDIPKVESIDLDKFKIRENFEQVGNKNSENNYNLFSSDLIKIIIIILIMYMIIFRKK